MNKNNNTSQYALLNYRFECLMISSAKANLLVGKSIPGLLRFEDTEQGYARRELLKVEKQAIEDRKHQEITDSSYIDSVRNQFHQELLKQFETEIVDTQSLYCDILGFNDALPELFDMLAIKASSIARLEPLAARVPWLYEELVKVVNSPQYRRKDSRGKVIIVETLRAALSFINIDNLKMIIPALAFRPTIPQVTDPYPQIKLRAWQYSLGVAITAKHLASSFNIKENDAFVLGMLQGLGRNAVARLYFRLFERVQREQLEIAQRDKLRDRHTALSKITPSSNFLIALWSDFGSKTTARIVEHMQCQRLFITEAAKALIVPDGYSEVPLAKLIQQAQIYCQYRMLSLHNVISIDEAKSILRRTQLPVSMIEQLKSLNLSTLPVTMKLDMNDSE